MSEIDEVIECLDKIKERIAANIKSSGEWASGRTAESMIVIQTDRGGRLEGRPYFQSLEDGRPAGKVPYDFKQIIAKWIEDKGISVTSLPYKRDIEHKYTPYERGLNTMAAAIAHTIATQGTKLYRDGGRDDIYSNVITEEVEALKQKLTLDYVETIAKSLNLN